MYSYYFTHEKQRKVKHMLQCCVLGHSQTKINSDVQQIGSVPCIYSTTRTVGDLGLFCFSGGRNTLGMYLFNYSLMASQMLQLPFTVREISQL